MTFTLGTITATPGALETLEEHEITPLDLINRHAKGDWGDVDRVDARSNEKALKDGGRLLSAYQISKEVRIWIITEADRTSTCILLPDEY